MDSQPATASFREFAALLGCKPSYVTELRTAGRLVLDEAGTRVLVEASRERIAATRDPARAGVSARHAAARGAALAVPSIAEQAPQPPADAAVADHGDDFDIAVGSSGYQHWRERSERAKALAAERDNKIADGKLLDAAEVAQAVADAVTTLRTRLESLPDILSPQLAAVEDETSARALLAGEIEHALDDCARRFGVIAKEQANG